MKKTLRALKQDKLADDFVVTMNHAAEKAVPEAAGVFGDAIKGMSIADAKTILAGTTTPRRNISGDDRDQLVCEVPAYCEAGDRSDRRDSAYKQLMAKAEGANSLARSAGRWSGASPWMWTPTSPTRPSTASSRWWLTRRNSFARTRPPHHRLAPTGVRGSRHNPHLFPALTTSSGTPSACKSAPMNEIQQPSPPSPTAAAQTLFGPNPPWKAWTVWIAAVFALIGACFWARDPAQKPPNLRPHRPRHDQPRRLTFESGPPNPLKPTSPAVFRLGVSYLGGFFLAGPSAVLSRPHSS